MKISCIRRPISWMVVGGILGALVTDFAGEYQRGFAKKYYPDKYYAQYCKGVASQQYLHESILPPSGLLPEQVGHKHKQNRVMSDELPTP
jgi:hypothetical protein